MVIIHKKHCLIKLKTMIFVTKPLSKQMTCNNDETETIVKTCKRQLTL